MAPVTHLPLNSPTSKCSTTSCEAYSFEPNFQHVGLWETHSNQSNAMYQLIFHGLHLWLCIRKPLPNLTSSIFPSTLSCFVNLSSVFSTLIYFELGWQRTLQFISGFSFIFIHSCQIVPASFAGKKPYLLYCFFSFVYLDHDAVTYILISPSSTKQETQKLMKQS